MGKLKFAPDSYIADHSHNFNELKVRRANWVRDLTREETRTIGNHYVEKIQKGKSFWGKTINPQSVELERQEITRFFNLLGFQNIYFNNDDGNAFFMLLNDNEFEKRIVAYQRTSRKGRSFLNWFDTYMNIVKEYDPDEGGKSKLVIDEKVSILNFNSDTKWVAEADPLVSEMRQLRADITTMLRDNSKNLKNNKQESIYDNLTVEILNNIHKNQLVRVVDFYNKIMSKGFNSDSRNHASQKMREAIDDTVGFIANIQTKSKKVDDKYLLQDQES